MVAIADFVAEGNYDVVVLQEVMQKHPCHWCHWLSPCMWQCFFLLQVWSTRDYVTLSCKILDKMPYSHYFYRFGKMSSCCRYFEHKTALTSIPLSLAVVSLAAVSAYSLATQFWRLCTTTILSMVKLTRCYMVIGMVPKAVALLCWRSRTLLSMCTPLTWV